MNKDCLGSAVCVLISYLFMMLLAALDGKFTEKAPLHLCFTLCNSMHVYTFKGQNTTCLGTIMKVLEFRCWIQY